MRIKYKGSIVGNNDNNCGFPKNLVEIQRECW